MKLKLSKKTLRLIALAVGVFIIAFFVSSILTTGSDGKGGGGAPPAKGFKTEIKNGDADYTAIFVILGLLVVALGYGFYTERKRRRRR